MFCYTEEQKLEFLKTIENYWKLEFKNIANRQLEKSQWAQKKKSVFLKKIFTRNSK